jgi:hypothetical protein
MSDIKKSFNELALESILFKGQNDWYFCFLKSEKIAHVLALLSEKMAHSNRSWFLGAVDDASDLPSSIAYFAAGDMDIQLVLAQVFSLIANIRISATRGCLSKETALYIAAEYEKIAEKLAASNHPSPFVSPQDFSVPEFLTRPQAPHPLPLEAIPESLTDQKSGYTRRKQESSSEGSVKREEIGDRSGKILNFVLQNKAVSIKEICSIMPEYSEKTVQRELTALIAQGLLKREGERRWSVYKPA